MALINDSSKEDTVLVPVTEFLRLLKRNDWLSCLERNGVDNWEWYGDAQEEFEKGNEE